MKRVEDRARFDMDLNRPVPGRESERDVEAEKNEFNAFMTSMKR